VTDSHPEHRLFGQATPGPAPTLRSRRACRLDRNRSRCASNPATSGRGFPSTRSWVPASYC
jgi:hypothetical protein